MGFQLDIDSQTRAVAKDLVRVNPADLRPDWPAQVSRVVVPCVNKKSHQWHRTGPVITLGEMCLALGASPEEGPGSASHS